MAYDDLFNMGRGRFDMGLLNDPAPTKIGQDRYDVYVNQDYIGQKYLLTAQESVSDIDEFLKNEGVNNFESYLDGDHYYIKAVENEQRVSDVLKVYLQNR
ncbi:MULTISPECIES: hypothetical protein [Bacillaceae]|uniref:GyrI-like small molecule binding domain-containing protein n=1 Tax=Metabacillus endolithicus TaxID=1535204 RepID=A0ABW5C0L0_9BACI|nr:MULTISPECIES: hypothetical protein [Bacillaceae]PGT90525.1 hypothetical protein COD11_02360 [Bacillus sp. AFS040349]UGB30846.1 hypothetical protein LPC09_24685 [Metabacillus sp. B2-18]UPG65714.1 hypothetical protein MVE64_12500 [Metabacillus endolithicus]